MFIFQNFVFLCFVTFILPKSIRTLNENENRWTSDEMRSLPSADHGWAKMRKENYLYVDKTSFIKRLTKNTLMLLTRPSRFGKTNFLKMVKHFYQGDHSLFDGLSVHEQGNVEWMRNILPRDMRNTTSKWLKFPVIYLDFGGSMMFSTYQQYKECVYKMLRKIAINYGIYNNFNENVDISQLITELNWKFKLPVILLIDEYDSPYRRAKFQLKDDKLADKVVSFCAGFYKSIESTVEELGFAFITGVLSFSMNSKLDIAGSSKFQDITYSKEMANAFGLTQNEIRGNFGYHVYEFAKWRANQRTHGSNKTHEPTSCEIEAIFEELIRRFDGYQFDMECESDKVLNIVSTLTSISEKSIDNYWSWSQTEYILPIIRQFYERQASLCEYRKGHSMDESILLQPVEPSVSRIPMNKMLLSYGYFTIAEFHQTGIRWEILLKFPNDEIKDTIESHLVDYDSERKNFFKYLPSEGTNNLKMCFNNMMEDVETAMTQLSNFKFQPYNYSYEFSEGNTWTLTTDEMPKRLRALFTYKDIESNSNIEFLKENSSDPAGNIDLLTLNLQINAAIQIKCTKKTTSVTAIKELMGYYENHRVTFMKKLGNPDQFHFIGLHYEIESNTHKMKLRDWIHLPYYDGQLQIKHMKFSSGNYSEETGKHKVRDSPTYRTRSSHWQRANRGRKCPFFSQRNSKANRPRKPKK